MFSVLQLLLIFRINVKWGINDLAFALGDDAIGTCVVLAVLVWPMSLPMTHAALPIDQAHPLA